jgi:long-subunit fatty acid transport protein
LALACAILVLLVITSRAKAQDVAGAFDPSRAGAIEIEFSFSNPGARSLGMGGAFIGRADDATAAYANPAGLVQLRAPELSLETRSWTFPVSIGVPSASPAGIVPELQLDEQTTGVSFGSYVYPAGHWTLALYRHEQADYDIRGQAESISASMVGNGLAAAYRFDSGLSIGAAVLLTDLSLTSVAPCSPVDPSCLGPQLSRGEVTDVVGNVGVLWQVSPRWSLGGVYRRGPRLRVRNFVLSPGGQPQPTGTGYTFRISDVAGLGVGLRPTSHLVLNFDFVRVFYSQSVEETSIRSALAPQVELGRVSLDDADELHFGLEYSFWNKRGAPALRLGSWFEPAHRIAFQPSGSALDCTPPFPISEFIPAPSARIGRCALAERFDGGNDRVHVSAGVGFVLGRRFQLDAAADISRETQTFSVSTLVRF